MFVLASSNIVFHMIRLPWCRLLKCVESCAVLSVGDKTVTLGFTELGPGNLLQ